MEQNEDIIYQRIKVILDRMEQKKQLQALANQNGLPINELVLTDDTSDMVAISVIALMLAKFDNDPRYRKLTDLGMQKRSLKVEIINDYKQRANMLYNTFKNGGYQNTNVVDPVDNTMVESYYDFDESEYITESMNDDIDIDDFEFFEESDQSKHELTIDMKCKQFIIDKIHELVPDAEPLSIRGFVKDHAYGIEWFIKLNDKKYQSEQLVDEDMVDQDDMEKTNKEIARKFREQSDYDSTARNDFDIKLDDVEESGSDDNWNTLESLYGHPIPSDFKTAMKDRDTRLRFEGSSNTKYDFGIADLCNVDRMIQYRKNNNNEMDSNDYLHFAGDGWGNSLILKYEPNKHKCVYALWYHDKFTTDDKHKVIVIADTWKDLMNQFTNEDIVEEGFGFTTKKNICNRVCEQISIVNPFIEELDKKIDEGEIKDPKTFRKWYRQDVKVSYGYTGGSTGSGDPYFGTTANYEYGEPTLDNYIYRSRQVLKMATRDRYIGKVFTREEHDKLYQGYNLLEHLTKEMNNACMDGFNAFKEYNPKRFKELLSVVSDRLKEWITLSKEINEFCENKIH